MKNKPTLKEDTADDVQTCAKINLDFCVTHFLSAKKIEM